MHFAAPFKEYNCLIDKQCIDEYNILYTEESTREQLENFIADYADGRRINIMFREAINIDELARINNLFPDTIYVRVLIKDIPQVNSLRAQGINFFFDSSIPIGTYLALDWAIKVHPTDIYLYDDLHYDLSHVSKLCHDNDIRIRMILNETPVTNDYLSNMYSAPLYRPQDFMMLDNYIDTAEFNCDDTPFGLQSFSYNSYDWVKAKAQYRIWFIDHAWDSEMFYLNRKNNFQIPSSYIPDSLSENRIKCQYNCTRLNFSTCKRCERLFNLASYKQKLKEDIDD